MTFHITEILFDIEADFAIFTSLMPSPLPTLVSKLSQAMNQRATAKRISSRVVQGVSQNGK